MSAVHHILTAGIIGLLSETMRRTLDPFCSLDLGFQKPDENSGNEFLDFAGCPQLPWESISGFDRNGHTD